MLDKILAKIEKFLPEKWRWVLNHEGFKRYFANTGWMFGGQIFSLLIAFFISAWLARYLGPENYGVLNYAVAFAGLFSFIASLGVDGILNRELVKFPEKRDELLGTAFRLKLIGGSVAFLFVVLSVAIFKISPLLKFLIIFYAFSFILQALNVISIYFQAEVKSKNSVKAVLLATVISSLLKIAVILAGQGVIWVMAVYVLDALWQGLGFIGIYRKFGLKIKAWRFNKSLAQEILKNSWPLMLASAAGLIYLRIDQVMIGALLGNRAVGLYAAAVRLVEVWYFIPIIICTSLFPAIINAKKISLAVYYGRLKKLYILMTAIAVVLAIPTTFLAKPIIYFLFGAGYLAATPVLQIYIWSSWGLFLSVAVTQYLMSENLVKNIFWFNFLAMLINVILNFIFIPLFGLVGAALATLVSYLVVPLLVFSGLLARRQEGL
jgi:O-antigen/teichoic acid export membrane protein